MEAGPGDTILVVDDDEMLRRRLARAFSDRGFQTGEASNRDEALRIVRSSKPKFAVVDLKLGTESGLELLRELLAIAPALRAVILTGYGTISTAVDAVKAGAVQYLTKPVHADAVLEAFEAPALARTRQAETPPPELAQVEWDYIHRIVGDCDGNITRASKLLGLHRRSLQRKLSKNPRNLK